MKENALLEKKLQQEVDEIKDYASGLKDSSEFETWKAKMEAKDQAEKEAAVQIRKAEISGLNEKVRKIVAVKTQQKIQEA